MGAEEALEAAIVGMVAADGGVKEMLGDPVRIAGGKTPRPAYPYLEVVRHESEPVGGTDAELSLHRLDLAAVSRQADGVEAKAVMARVRAALAGAEPEMEDWSCILLTPVFMDTTRRRVGEWRALLRLKAIVEPV